MLANEEEAREEWEREKGGRGKKGREEERTLLQLLCERRSRGEHLAREARPRSRGYATLPDSSAPFQVQSNYSPTS